MIEVDTKKIYVIGVGNLITDKNDREDLVLDSYPGWFSKKEDAERALKENWGDIHEHAYDYAVLECVEEGLYRPDPNTRFFKFNHNTYGYEEIEAPESQKNFCGYTIG